jgi:hypothetical protein
LTALAWLSRATTPAICTALTRANRRTGFGRMKVSVFYWLPLVGLTFAARGGWPWALWAVPFVLVECAAAVSEYVASR